MAESKMNMNSRLHIAMFPWLAFGHFLPFLHLSNKLAHRGIKVSLLFPKGVVPKLAKLNKFPHLIQFFPLTIPHADGLPLGAETLSDIPVELESHLCTAMDRTEDQVRAALTTIKPDFVFFDFSHWIPALGRELGFKTVMFLVHCAAMPALASAPSNMAIRGSTLEDIMEKEPFLNQNAEFGSGISFTDRMGTAINGCDALAIRSGYEMEAHFVDQVAKGFNKLVLLTGPVLPEKAEGPLEAKWENLLNKFQSGSVVFCALGSQTVLTKSQFREMISGFELSGLPFLVALSRPNECRTMEEALPDGF